MPTKYNNKHASFVYAHVRAAETHVCNQFRPTLLLVAPRVQLKGCPLAIKVDIVHEEMEDALRSWPENINISTKNYFDPSS